MRHDLLREFYAGREHIARRDPAATGGTSVKGSVTVSSLRDGPDYVVRFINHGTATVWTVTKDGRRLAQVRGPGAGLRQ